MLNAWVLQSGLKLALELKQQGDLHARPEQLSSGDTLRFALFRQCADWCIVDIWGEGPSSEKTAYQVSPWASP